MICLDTNAVRAALNDRTSPVRARIDKAIRLNHPLAISSIVLFELWYGAAKSARLERNARRIADFLAGRSSPRTPRRRATFAPLWSGPERPLAPMIFSSPHKRAGATPSSLRQTSASSPVYRG
jgi:predicted nucleic acid-binding protein